MDTGINHHFHYIIENSMEDNKATKMKRKKRHQRGLNIKYIF